MDLSNLPEGNHTRATEIAWQTIIYLLGLIGVGWMNGKKAGRAEAKAEEAVEDIAELKRSEFVTKSELVQIQGHCQEHTWDKLLLALEQRDREFDRKFSTICQGIAEIKVEIKKQ